MCTSIVENQPWIPFDRFSTFSHLIRVTAWVFQFITNCWSKKLTIQRNGNPLTVQELNQATRYWVKTIQNEAWNPEVCAIKKCSRIRQTSRILSLNPFLDEFEILCVGGRQENAKAAYDNRHPIILPSNHPLVKILIRSEHIRLLHASFVDICFSLKTIPHRWRTQGHQVNHTQLCCLQTTISQIKFSNDGTTTQGTHHA